MRATQGYFIFGDGVNPASLVFAGGTSGASVWPFCAPRASGVAFRMRTPSVPVFVLPCLPPCFPLPGAPSLLLAASRALLTVLFGCAQARCSRGSCGCGAVRLSRSSTTLKGPLSRSLCRRKVRFRYSPLPLFTSPALSVSEFVAENGWINARMPLPVIACLCFVGTHAGQFVLDHEATVSNFWTNIRVVFYVPPTAQLQLMPDHAGTCAARL